RRGGAAGGAAGAPGPGVSMKASPSRGPEGYGDASAAPADSGRALPGRGRAAPGPSPAGSPGAVRPPAGRPPAGRPPAVCAPAGPPSCGHNSAGPPAEAGAEPWDLDPADAPPPQLPPLPRDPGLDLPEPEPERPGWGAADLARGIKPRAALMNSLLGMLLRPGLVREQAARWRAVRDAARLARRRPWARTYAMADLLEEAERIAALAGAGALEDERAGAPQGLRETRAYNAALALLDQARSLAIPGLLLPPAGPGGPPRYAAFALRRRRPGEAAFPCAAGGVPVAGFAEAGEGEAERHAVLHLENREVLGVFLEAGNAERFAEALNSPALRLLGAPEAARAEGRRLLGGRAPLPPAPAPPRALPPMLPEEMAAAAARIRRAGEGGDPAYLTLGEARSLAWLRESGAWRRRQHPVTLDLLPEEMALGHWGEPAAQWVFPRASELPPERIETVPGPDGLPARRGVPVYSDDPVLALVQRRAVERVLAGPAPDGGVRPGPAEAAAAGLTAGEVEAALAAAASRAGPAARAAGPAAASGPPAPRREAPPAPPGGAVPGPAPPLGIVPVPAAPEAGPGARQSGPPAGGVLREPRPGPGAAGPVAGKGQRP
ncbi:MAG: hypothetical protein LBG06_05760, partial [Deltaproteobacteria bacterium]|nr:hypothetical protein [Deltaproteobacteria bacterium]